MAVELNNQKFYVVIGDSTITNIKRFTFTKSIMNPCSTLEFETSKQYLANNKNNNLLMFVPGKMIRAFISGYQIFTGYITSTSKTNSENSDSITVNCKDIIWRLKTTILNHTRGGINGKMPFPSIVLWALDGLKKMDERGLPKTVAKDDWFFSDDMTIFYNKTEAINLMGQKDNEDVFSDLKSIKESDIKPKPGESIYDFLKRLLKGWGYILQADEFGNLIFYRPNNWDWQNKKDKLFRFSNPYEADSYIVFSSEKNLDIGMVNPIYNPSLDISLDDFPTQIFVVGASSFSGPSNADILNTFKELPKAINVANNYLLTDYYNTDENIPSNPLVIFNEELKSKAACEKTAKRKRGFALANSYKYRFSTTGFGVNVLGNFTAFTCDVPIWVVDEINDVDGVLLVVGITMTGNVEFQQTEFECTSIQALLLE